jgi:hypothetical protein
LLGQGSHVEGDEALGGNGGGNMDRAGICFSTTA